jgi:diaminohydroxyphosphoribosylaminopyrimidine deaminase/5-amino-6-(5-phosphoribosylamino)uracil reductase
MSLDGRLSRPADETQWLTCRASRRVVQQIRQQADAIIVGPNTLRRDNPKLTLRNEAEELVADRRQPLRIILSRSSPCARHQSQNSDAKLYPANEINAALGPEKGYHILQDEFAARSYWLAASDPTQALNLLTRELGVQTLLLEAGGKLQGTFLDHQLIDEIHYFYAPLLCGGPDLAVGGNGLQSIPARPNLLHPKWRKSGRDLHLHALVRNPPK